MGMATRSPKEWAFDVGGAALRALLTAYDRRRLPMVQGRLALAGLSGGVEIIRDHWGVPHIYADASADLYFALGFVHAQDRLWQMELHRRIGTGRLSEVFGEVTLDTDRMARTAGFERIGRADLAAAGPEELEVLNAYAAGVNAWMDHSAARLPVEFTLLRYRPEPWRVEDTMAFSRVMIWQLSHAWYGEIVRAQLIEAVGEERARELEVCYPEANPITLPAGIEFRRLVPDLGTTGIAGLLDRGLGSNAWVTTGARSDTGAPYLCNDMHLPVAMPSLWYLVHLQGADMHVAGCSVPGLPPVLVGHNERVAWGITLAYTDCEDLFAEEFESGLGVGAPDVGGAGAGTTAAPAPARGVGAPTVAGPTAIPAGAAAPAAAVPGAAAAPPRYRCGDTWKSAVVIRETIGVKGRTAPHVEEVVLTRHGPIISDITGVADKRLALQSMALRPCPALKGLLRLDRAGSWEEFKEAMRLIEAPQLNIVYADVYGNTGFWVTGMVPVRAAGDGTLPAPGWAGTHEWMGHVPFAEMPHALNPERGFVVSCNHRIVPDEYPHHLGHVWMNGYRARRLEDVLSRAGTMSAADHQKLHTDVLCLPGIAFVQWLERFYPVAPTSASTSGRAAAGPAVGRVADPTTRVRADASGNDAPAQDDVALALELLRAWHGRLDIDSVGGSVYETTRNLLVRGLLEPRLSSELTDRVMGTGFHPLVMPASELYGHELDTVLRLLDDPDSWWVDGAGGARALVDGSLAGAVAFLRRELGADPAGWRWGRFHQLVFPHALGLQPPLDRVFDRGPYPVGGDTDTVCQMAMAPGDPYQAKGWAPTYRQVVDLADLSQSVWIQPPGQSGRLGSPHYDDLTGPWLAGEYLPMLWTRAQVDEAAVSRLVLDGSE